MKLPDNVVPDAVRWLTAKLNGREERAREVMGTLLEKDIVGWNGAAFSLDGTRRELLAIAPELLDMPELTRRIQAGDREARSLAIDHDLMNARRQAPAVSHGRMSYEETKAALEAEMRKQGLHV
jgi:hypothetical protein